VATATKTGRPRRDEEATLGQKLSLARELVVHRTPIATLRRLSGRSPSTLYRWVRDVCASDHPDADAIRALAERRGLWAPPPGPAPPDPPRAD